MWTPPSGNPVVTGTVISSTVQNNTIADIANGLTDCVTKDGQSTPTANIPMGGFRITGLGNASARTDAPTTGQVQDNAFSVLASIGGTGDAITAGVVPSITAYAVGQKFLYNPTASNTIVAPTIAISGLTPITIIQSSGAALAAGALRIGVQYDLLFDGTNFRVQSGALAAGLNGQCRLTFVSPTQLLLSPYNGNTIVIGGVPRQIPAAGITFSNSGLTSSAKIYVYVAMVGNVITPTFSVTGHVPDANGIEVQSGQPLATLVGVVQTTAGAQFQQSTSVIGVLSWFNRRPLQILSATGTPSTASLSATNLFTTASFLSWADTPCQLVLSGSASNTVTNNGASVQIQVDGVLSGSTSTLSPMTSSSGGFSQTVNSVASIPAGVDIFHTCNAFGNAIAGGTAAFVTTLAGMTYG